MTGIKTFVETVLKGGRFEKPTPFLVPSILPDLDAYIEIIRAIASDLYFEKNPNKKKLPNGFDERLTLGITKIEMGSTIPVFEREYLEENWENDEFDQARDRLNEYLFLIQNGKNDPKNSFSKKVIVLFPKFGKNLKKNETITIKAPNSINSPIYSKEIMSKVISLNKKPYEDVCFLNGAISGYESENRELYIITKDSERSITSHFPEAFDLELKDAARDYKLKNGAETTISVIGRAKYNPDGSINLISELQHIILQKEEKKTFLPDPFKRLTELFSLKEGWFDGKGASFEGSTFDLKKWLHDFLEYSKIPAPYCYPSPDNTIELEWSFGFWEISCSFDFEKQYLYLHATNLRSEEIREDAFSFDNPHSIEKTAEFLENLLIPQTK